MARVNLLKQVKIDDRWVLRSIPKKANGQRDWSALPDGNTSSSFAKKGNVAAYPRERQSPRRSKSSGESTPNLKRSPSVSSCLDLAQRTCRNRYRSMG